MDLEKWRALRAEGKLGLLGTDTTMEFHRLWFERYERKSRTVVTKCHLDYSETEIIFVNKLLETTHDGYVKGFTGHCQIKDYSDMKAFWNKPTKIYFIPKGMLYEKAQEMRKKTMPYTYLDDMMHWRNLSANKHHIHIRVNLEFPIDTEVATFLKGYDILDHASGIVTDIQPSWVGLRYIYIVPKGSTFEEIMLSLKMGGIKLF